MVNTAFLPISLAEVKARGWAGLDIVIISGDAYVDHPSYGVAVIGRVLEEQGFRVGIIAQPDWRSREDFLQLGRPRLFFGITSGNVDSMVANYNANKRPRRVDDYSPGGKVGLRPDRAVIVYANRVRECWGDIPIVLGGLEASLRRLAHYDYWDDAVRRSILVDAKADLLVYGMAETPIVEIARCLQEGRSLSTLNHIRGTAVVRKDCGFLQEYVALPSFEEARGDKEKFSRAFRLAYAHMNPFSGRPLVQQYGDRFIVQFPAALPLSSPNLDRIHELPYSRQGHPAYDRYGGLKGLETVRFSIISHRGCCGECSFCSLYFHQGRIVQSRSLASIIREAGLLSQDRDFRGTITDIGGPTANMYKATCQRWQRDGFCSQRNCLLPQRCGNLKLGYPEALEVYKRIAGLPRVKHVFVSSGFRYDLLTQASDSRYLEEVCRNHISGQMKVAPEHTADKVLRVMNKSPLSTYERFLGRLREVNKKLSRKVYLVNYFISSHPGTRLKEARQLSAYLRRRRMCPEQIQDFIPLPMTLSGCMYYTGINPLSGEKVYVPRSPRERRLQRSLIQYRSHRHERFEG